MGKAIKKQLAVMWEDCLSILVVNAGIVLFGMALHYVITRFDRTIDTYFEMGTMMGAMIGGMMLFIFISTNFCQNFQVEISMGLTRKKFFVSYFVVTVLFSFLELLMLVVVNRVEKWFEPLLYPGMKNEMDFFPYLVKWGPPMCVALTILAAFCGALVMRFGKKAGTLLWMLWMVGILVFPRLLEASKNAPNSVFGMAGSALRGMLAGVPVNLWIAGIVVLNGAALIVTYRILRRQQVNG